MGINSYLRFRATGRTVTTDPSDEFIHSDSSGAAFHVLSDDERTKFPLPRPAADVLGPLSIESARDLGVTRRARVINGFGDLPAIATGAGPSNPDATHIYIGTSAWLAIIDGPESSPASFLLDSYTRVALYPLQTGGLAFDWIVEELYGHQRTHLEPDFLDHINGIVDSVPAGAGDLIATHWLNGEGAPLSKAARGVFLNLNTTHHKSHMVRAMMESICYSLRSAVEAAEHDMSTALTNLTVVGGGASSDVWMQMLADVLDRTLIVPHEPRYTGVLGGLRCAYDTDAHMPHVPTTAFTPVPANTRTYDRLYSVYTRLHDTLLPLFEELNTP